MIEPQNTLLPIAAGPTPSERPNGDMTFGEMLAQTLGMNPQLDGAAIAPISDEGGDEEHAASGKKDNDADLSSTRRNQGEMLAGLVVVPRPFVVARPGAGPIVNGPVTDGEPGVAMPVEAVPTEAVPTEAVPAEGEGTVGGVPVDPEVVPGGAMPDAYAPPVGIGETPPGDALPRDDGSDPEPVTVPVPEDAKPWRGDLPVRPEPVDGDAPAPIPGDVPPGDTPPLDSSPFEGVPGQPADPQPIHRIDPADLERSPVETNDQRVIPEDPVPGRRPVDAPPPNPVTGTLAPVAVQLPAARPVQVAAAEVALSGADPVSVRDTKIKLEPASSRVDAPVPAFSTENTSGAAPTVSNFGGPAVPTQHTALAERVLEAVELQANQPPPRTMIVDLPEIEGLRLVVSVRSGAEVHVVPSSTSANHAGLQPFLNELEGVLADRGFVMTGDGRRRGSNQANDEEPELPRRRRPTYARPLDDDLRI